MKAKSMAVRPAPAPRDGGWAPRLVQEARLAELDALLARQAGAEDVNLEVERAVLLGALNRHQDAQQAFVAVLRKAPTHFSALNEFGTLLTNTGAIEAACRVYAEAILHHPDNPLARVNLANLLLRANRYKEAREHYERALQVDPDHAPAHQGLGAVLADLGDREAAREHFRRGFRGHAVSTLPYRGDQPPISLLQLVSSGGGNIPSGLFLDDTRFLTSVVVADHLDPLMPLPSHQIIFNAIGDADLCEVALKAAARIVAGANVPVINDPRAVMKTGRIGNAERLRGIPGVRTARTMAIARDSLAGPDGARTLAARGFSFPLLLRSPGYHTGRNFVLVEAAADLAAAAQNLPGDALLAIEYLDARGRDGKARKFRVMKSTVPSIRCISRSRESGRCITSPPTWRMRRAIARKKQNFLRTCPPCSVPGRCGRWKRFRAALGLDYAGIDFALADDGDLLLFEANATMVIAKPNDDARWAYRRGAIDRVLEAVVAMLMQRSQAASRGGGR